MKKLTIIYKTNDMLHCKETEMRMNFLKPVAELWIGTEETEKLRNLVSWIIKELRKSTWLEEEEELQLSEFDRYFIDFEQESEKRIDGETYNLCKMAYRGVEEGKTTWEHLVSLFEEDRCSECM